MEVVDLTVSLDGAVRIHGHGATELLRPVATPDGLQQMSQLEVSAHAVTHIDLPGCLASRLGDDWESHTTSVLGEDAGSGYEHTEERGSLPPVTSANCVVVDVGQRGETENRIKELKNDLQSDRTSCHRFVANQFRLLLHAAAFLLCTELRRHLAETSLAQAQVSTLQRRLFKLGVRVRETARKIWLEFASGCLVQELWPLLLGRLRAAPT